MKPFCYIIYCVLNFIFIIITVFEAITEMFKTSAFIIMRKDVTPIFTNNITIDFKIKNLYDFFVDITDFKICNLPFCIAYSLTTCNAIWT